MNRAIALIICLMLFQFAAEAQSKRTVIKSVKFSGNRTIENNVLLDQMNTHPKSFLQKLTFWKKGNEFSQTLLDDDIERLIQYYYSNGFPAAHIGYEIKSPEDSRKIKLKILIDEGKPVKIRNIEWSELQDSAQAAILARSIKRLPLKPKKIFRDDDVYDTESRIKTVYSYFGYPVTSLSRSLRLSADTSFVDIRFDVHPGPYCNFGEINLSGDSLVPRKYIMQHVTVRPGEMFSVRQMDNTQKRLSALDLFSFVVVRAATDSITNNRIPVSIRVGELPRWTLKAGVGYGTEDRLRLSADVTRRNFLGGARKLVFNAQHSYFDPIILDLKFIQPNFPLYRVDMTLNPYLYKQHEESFDAERLGAGLSFLHNFGKRSSVWLSFVTEKTKLTFAQGANLDSLTAVKQGYRNKSGISVGTNIDFTNDIFDPSRGIKISGSFSYMGPAFNADLTYYKALLELSHYYSPSRRWVLATRLRGGILDPIGKSTESPPEERFYLGGASSMRGWARNGIFITDAKGNIFGGNSLLEADVELRFPIKGIFGGAVFVEAGNIWNSPKGYNLRDLHYDAGIGVRIKTPIGPGRVDFAMPVFDGKPKLQFHISIGHAF